MYDLFQLSMLYWMLSTQADYVVLDDGRLGSQSLEGTLVFLWFLDVLGILQGLGMHLFELLY